MERLTKRYIDGQAYVPLSAVSRLNDECVGLPITKLAQYEELEEQGLLVKLPCKVGDKYFEIETHFWGEREKCEGCEYFHEGDSIFRDDPCCTYSDSHDDKEPYGCLEVREKVFRSIEHIVWHMDRGDFNKTVFLSQDQSEQALQAMNKEARNEQNII